MDSNTVLNYKEDEKIIRWIVNKYIYSQIVKNTNKC